MDISKSDSTEKLLENLTLDSLPNVVVSTSTLESKPKDVSKSTAGIRHCAFCLQVCEPVKKCGGCKKRAYCFKDCQTADWKVNGTGQGHKNWCSRYEYGEEDIDWEVVPVPNKGLGIVAKRLIPAGFRILVEHVYTDPHAHPDIENLEPKEASLEDKFQWNQLILEPRGSVAEEKREYHYVVHGVTRPYSAGETFVGLRTSRMNHDCHPNAGCSYDETARVVIIFAQRNIQPGEEICLDYSPFPRLFQKTLHKLSSCRGACLDPSSRPRSSKCVMLCPPLTVHAAEFITTWI